MKIALAAGFLLMGTLPATAATLELRPVLRGCIEADGALSCGSGGSNTTLSPITNFQTENDETGSDFTRSIFLFDLSAVTEEIASADIAISVVSEVITSERTSETVEFYTLSDESEALIQQRITTAEIFEDAGSGRRIASIDFRNTLFPYTVQGTLHSNFVDALNEERGGLFGIGARISDNSSSNTIERVFNDSQRQPFSITLAFADGTPVGQVPVPASGFLALFAFAGLFGLLRRRSSRLVNV